MLEDLLDDHRDFNTGNDLHAPTTVPAGLDADPEYALETLARGACITLQAWKLLVV